MANHVTVEKACVWSFQKALKEWWKLLTSSSESHPSSWLLDSLFKSPIPVQVFQGYVSPSFYTGTSFSWRSFLAPTLDQSCPVKQRALLGPERTDVFLYRSSAVISMHKTGDAGGRAAGPDQDPQLSASLEHLKNTTSVLIYPRH